MHEYINTGAMLREAFQAVVNNLHEKLAELGYGDITPAHGWVFQYIEEAGSRVTVLARQANMTKQSMSYLVYDLEDKGYLERHPDPEDKRAVLFKLTQKGVELKKLARSINFAYEQGWAQAIGTERYNLLREILRELREKALGANGH